MNCWVHLPTCSFWIATILYCFVSISDVHKCQPIAGSNRFLLCRCSKFCLSSTGTSLVSNLYYFGFLVYNFHRGWLLNRCWLIAIYFGGFSFSESTLSDHTGFRLPILLVVYIWSHSFWMVCFNVYRYVEYIYLKWCRYHIKCLLVL